MAEMEAVEGGEAQLAEAHSSTWRTPTFATCGATTSSASSATRGCGSDPTAPSTSPRARVGRRWATSTGPEAVEHTVRRAAAVTGLPVVVTEMGISTDDDQERIEFIDQVVARRPLLPRDGIDVRGLFYWTLLDNFEWVLGYSQPFGLVACDRETFERRPKPSATHLGRDRRVRASLIRSTEWHAR